MRFDIVKKYPHTNGTECISKKNCCHDISKLYLFNLLGARSLILNIVKKSTRIQMEPTEHFTKKKITRWRSGTYGLFIHRSHTTLGAKPHDPILFTLLDNVIKVNQAISISALLYPVINLHILFLSFSTIKSRRTGEERHNIDVNNFIGILFMFFGVLLRIANFDHLQNAACLSDVVLYSNAML